MGSSSGSLNRLAVAVAMQGAEIKIFQPRRCLSKTFRRRIGPDMQHSAPGKQAFGNHIELLFKLSGFGLANSASPNFCSKEATNSMGLPCSRI